MLKIGWAKARSAWMNDMISSRLRPICRALRNRSRKKGPPWQPVSKVSGVQNIDLP
jgi:hypothetical protein